MSEDLGRWGDASPECSTCGRLLPGSASRCTVNRECPECEGGIVAAEPKEYDPRDGAEGYCPMYPPLTEAEWASVRSDKRYAKRTVPVAKPSTREAEREIEMPSMDDVYGGNTLKADEMPLNFKAVLTVERVSVQSVTDDKTDEKKKKLVVYFSGKEKGLMLNVTNANMMAEIAGSRDYDYWPGKSVLLFRTTTDYAGKRVPALRLEHVPAGAAATRQFQPPAPPPPVDPARDDAGFQASNEDVPF